MKLRLFLASAGLLAIAACSGQGGTSSVVPNSGGASGGAGALSATHLRVDLRSNTSDPKVRTACADAPKGRARCFALVRTDLFYKTKPAYVAQRAPAGSNLKALTSSGFFAPLDPAHIQSAYNLPSATAGAGLVVGIVDAYDDPSAESDLATYRAAFGLPVCSTANKCFRKLNQLGHTGPLPPPDAGWAEEISLDLDMVSATCPLCKITLVEADTNFFSDLAIAEVQASYAGAHEISNSYGGGEFEATDPAYSIPHSVSVASSGDGTWYSGPQQPCTLATVVCVGGTSIFPYNNARGWTETAWTGAGSGCSQLVAQPSFIPAPYTCSGTHMRTASDVSAVADPYTGVLVYDSYGLPPGYYVFGGTSVSSPIVASIYALAGNGGTVSNAASLWAAGAAHSASLNDVTIGNNGQEDVRNAVSQLCNWYVYSCYAMPGYDGPTGNGTPNGTGAF